MTYDNEFYLSGFRENNHKAMAQIYAEVYPRLSAHIKQNGGQTDLVWDVYAKGLETLLLKIRAEELELDAPLPHYLFGVCKNIYRSGQRKKKPDLTNPEDEAYISDDNIEQDIIEFEQVKLFKEKLLELGERCRKLLEARFEKISYEKIAETLDYPSAGNARTRYFQCKQQLVKKIKHSVLFKELKNG